MFWKIILMHIKYIYTYQILCYNLQLIFLTFLALEYILEILTCAFIQTFLILF